MFRQDFTCPALLEDHAAFYPYGAVTRYGPTFQTVPVLTDMATGLVRVRSPLLTESRLMSFPPATEMFQFAGFASHGLWIHRAIPLKGGLPHSEISGSKSARLSPELIAACHVLHRLSAPRHPPDALHSLAPLSHKQAGTGKHTHASEKRPGAKEQTPDAHPHDHAMPPRETRDGIDRLPLHDVKRART